MTKTKYKKIPISFGDVEPGMRIRVTRWQLNKIESVKEFVVSADSVGEDYLYNEDHTIIVWLYGTEDIEHLVEKKPKKVTEEVTYKRRPIKFSKIRRGMKIRAEDEEDNCAVEFVVFTVEESLSLEKSGRETTYFGDASGNYGYSNDSVAWTTFYVLED